MMFSRYAIYHVPGDGPLATFGAALLGWDASKGKTVPHPDIAGLPQPVDRITETPRKYGLHATIKPPFRLAPGTSEAALNDALAAFCTGQPPIRLDGLEVAQLGRFLALRPIGDETLLNGLAADAVRMLDGFRAPLSEAELARRRAANLTPEQDALLLKWGYPHVMEGFRFHITLTGKLPKAQISQTAEVLRAHLAPLLPQPYPVDTLCLMGEAEDGRFHQIARHALRG